MRIGGAVIVAAALLAACGGGGTGDAPRSAAQSGSGRTASAEEPATGGAALYRRACVMCHGERGAGSPLGPALNDRRREVAEVARVVEAGAPTGREEPYPSMPPRGDGAFTDADVRSVAEYVHSLAR